MEEILYYSALYDYYGGLFTSVQKEYFEDYFFNNLSLQEIAENHQISKNAVSKCLKEVKEKLKFYEEKLHLLENKDKIEKILSKEELDKIIKFI